MRSTVAIRLCIAGAFCAMFGSTTFASDAQSPFMAVRGKTAQPIGHHEFCQLHPSECEIRTPDPHLVSLTPKRWNELVAVNGSVNGRIIPATDQAIFGRPEVWIYPTKKGDCEDLVLLKRRLLMNKGWPASALLITVVRQKNGDGHAVLTVTTDRGDLVLDNLNPQVTLWNQTAYLYVKRQSEFDTGLWVAVEDGRATSQVGSLKKN